MPTRPGPLALLPRTITREGLIEDQHIREGRFRRSLALVTELSAALSGLESSHSTFRNPVPVAHSNRCG